jgi:DNA-binding GntR family transcriptional regulator
MSHPTPLVRTAVNRLLDRWRAVRGFPHRLGAEAALAAELGFSRTPVRTALGVLEKRGVVRRDDDGLWLRRAPRPADRYRDDTPAVSKVDAVEAAFYDRLARRELKAGDRFTELELARALATTTVPVREALARISRFGLLRKEPRRRWEIARLDARMVGELFDLRGLLEGFALQRALALDDADPAWAAFSDLLAEHRALAEEVGRDPGADIRRFSDLDTRFHGALIAAAANRYVAEMMGVIAMTIHFQLRDDAVGAEGMACGLREHPLILAALLARDAAGAQRALAAHLASARRIMLLAAGHP